MTHVKDFSEFLNESEDRVKLDDVDQFLSARGIAVEQFLSDEEVQEIDPGLHFKIEDYVYRHLFNWTEMCESDEEGDALDFFLGQRQPASWRVRSDGTIDVIVEGSSRESFNFEWEDEEGNMRTSNALDLLRGKVSYDFDEDCNNRFDLDPDIKEKVQELF